MPSPEMLTEVELVDVQVRVEVAPLAILVGCAVKEIAGADPEPLTLTTVEDVFVPPGPVAVAV